MGGSSKIMSTISADIDKTKPYIIVSFVYKSTKSGAKPAATYYAQWTEAIVCNSLPSDDESGQKQ